MSLNDSIGNESAYIDMEYQRYYQNEFFNNSNPNSSKPIFVIGQRSDWPYIAEIFSYKFYIFISQAIAQMLLIGLIVAVGRKCFELNLKKTAEHAFICTLALVAFAGEALLIRHDEFIDSIFSRRIVDTLHSGFGLLAFAVGIVGVAVKTWQKRERKREGKFMVPHFRSKHGFFGLVGIILLLCNVVTGLAAYASLSPSLRLFHRYFGLIAFILFMFSLFLSFNTGFARRNWKLLFIKLFKLITFFSLILSTYFEFRLLMAETALLYLGIASKAREFGNKKKNWHRNFEVPYY